MKLDYITLKLALIGIVGVVCLILSFLVLDLVEERQSAFEEAKQKSVPAEVTGVPQQQIQSEEGSEGGITDYRKIVRSVKYAILFFVLTFGCFFLFEVGSKIKIHPIQYFLVGAALALFYLLLLAFAEYIGFNYAYIVATGMILALISMYSKSVLRSGEKTGKLFGLLIAAYGYLYVILMLEQYALLFGSLIVFVLLGLVMFYTRNIDWYEYGKIEN